MTASNPFAERPSGRASYGVFVNTGSAVNAEVCVRAGASWVMLDLEHGAGSESNLLASLWAVRAAGGYSLVRVESAQSPRIARTLDLGADAIMIPGVNTSAEAETIVQAAQWPPLGSRGVSLQSRAGRYGDLSHAEVADPANAPFIVVQIETAEGLRNVREIAAVPGLGALFLGPTDLTHDLGIPGQLDHPDFTAAVETVAVASQDHGLQAGVLAGGREAAIRFVSAGYALIAIGSDASHLRGGLAHALPGDADTRAATDRRG